MFQWKQYKYVFLKPRIKNPSAKNPFYNAKTEPFLIEL